MLLLLLLKVGTLFRISTFRKLGCRTLISNLKYLDDLV